jgi:hypothetical protein
VGGSRCAPSHRGAQRVLDRSKPDCALEDIALAGRALVPDHGGAAFLALKLTSRHTPAINQPEAVRAADLKWRCATRRRDDFIVRVTANGLRSYTAAHRFPLRAVVVAGREGVRDLVQDRVAHLIDSVQQRKRARERNHPSRRLARSEAPPRVVEAERPVVQAVLLEQRCREMFCFEEVQPIFPSRKMI